MSEHKGREGDRWEPLLEQAENNLDVAGVTNWYDIPYRTGYFRIPNRELRGRTDDFRRDLTKIIYDININAPFVFIKQKWGIYEPTNGNFLLRDFFAEYMYSAYEVNLQINDILCILAHCRDINEAICLTQNTIQSYATQSSRRKKGDDEHPESPDIIIYTHKGEKFSFKMPSLNFSDIFTKFLGGDIESEAEDIEFEDDIEDEIEVEDEDDIEDEDEDDVEYDVDVEDEAAQIEDAAEEPVDEVTDEDLNEDFGQVLESEEETPESEPEISEPEASEPETAEPEPALESAPEAVPDVNVPIVPADNFIIKSIYCGTGKTYIQRCYDETNNKSPGTYVRVEIPFDKYFLVTRAMEDKALAGQLNNVKDPGEIESIFLRSHYTYKQVKNAVKFGGIESVRYNDGVVETDKPLAICCALAFAVSIWNGDDYNFALKKAVYSGLKVGGKDFILNILSHNHPVSVMSGLEKGRYGNIDLGFSQKAMSVLSDILENSADLYDKLAHLGNARPAAMKLNVLSNSEASDIFDTHISADELYNGSADSSANLEYEAIRGNDKKKKGGIFSKIAGIFKGKEKTGMPDAEEMVESFNSEIAEIMVNIINKRFVQYNVDYLLNQVEAESIVKKLSKMLDGKLLIDMYANNNPLEYADNLLKPLVEETAAKRVKVSVPVYKELNRALAIVLEEIASDKYSYFE